MSDDELNDDGVGFDTMEGERTTVPATEPQEAEAETPRASANDVKPQQVTLSVGTAARPHPRRALGDRSQKTSEAPIYQKKMKRPGLLERRKGLRRFENRRSVVTR